MSETQTSTKPAATTPAPTTERPKRRYSKRWKSVQRVERGTTKAVRRLANAVTEGVNVWIDERDKSASRRRDGAVRDARKNFRRALRKTVRKASEAPADVFDAFTQARVPEVLGLGRRWF